MLNNKKIGIIVQARMGSTRLPQKVLMDISGRPMILRILERLKNVRIAHKIIIAIPKTKDNKKLEILLKKNGFVVFKGSEKDVLSRYYMAAKNYGIDVVVRITSDCPLVDPEIIDSVIKKHLWSGADYTTNTLEMTFPRGLDTEVFNFDALERAYKEAKKNYQREHVTSYIREHPEKFRSVNIRNNKDISSMRWTVDEANDLKFVREIFKGLYAENKIFLTKDVLNFLKKYPQIAQINKNVKQKNLKI